MPDTYDYITLLCRLKAAQDRIKELESGERYIQLQELHQKEYRAYERKLRKSARNLEDAHRETIRVRNYWLQVVEDMQRELEQTKRKAAQDLKKMEKRALNAEKQREVFDAVHHHNTNLAAPADTDLNQVIGNPVRHGVKLLPTERAPAGFVGALPVQIQIFAVNRHQRRLIRILQGVLPQQVCYEHSSTPLLCNMGYNQQAGFVC